MVEHNRRFRRIEFRPRMQLPKAVRIAEFASAGIIAGMATYGGFELGYKAIEKFDPGTSSQPAEIETSPQLPSVSALDEYYHGFFGKDETQQEVDDAVIQGYLDLRQSSISFSESDLKTDPGAESSYFVDAQRKQVVLEGLDLLKNKFKLNESVKIDAQDNTAKVADFREFDLNNTYDLVLLDGLITSTIDRNWHKQSNEQKYQAEQKFNDVAWLVEHPLPVVIENDAFLFPRDNVLTDMSRIYKIIESLDYPIPSQINFVRHMPDEGVAGGWYDNNLNAIYLTNESDGGSLVHEEGHHQAARNPVFNQEKYNNFIESRVNKLVADGNEIPVLATFLTDYPLTCEPCTNKNVTEGEDFAMVFQYYFTQGVDFRKKLETLKVNGNPAYSVLLAKYDFIKMFAKSDEYIRDTELFNPKAGDVFTINGSGEGVGTAVFLRPKPSLDLEQGDYLLENNEEVVITEGPLDFTNPKTGEVTVWWKARGGFIGGKGPLLQPEFKQGWLSQEWLGNIVSHGDASQMP